MSTVVQDTPAPANRSAFIDFAKYLSGPALVQAVTKTAFAPLERLKIIYQAQNALFIHEKAHFKNFYDYFTRIPKEQGLKAFYRGNFANVMYVVPRSIAQFSFLENINATFFPEGERNISNVEYGFRKLGAAMFSGFLTLLFAYPMDLVKTRLSLDFAKSPMDRQFRGIMQTIGTTKEKGGFSGLYRGFWLANATNLPYFLTMFTSYQVYANIDKGSLTSSQEVLQYIAPASLAGLAATFVTYPLDTIKRRIQMNGYSANTMYKSTFDCLKKTLDKEGFFALYKGLTVTSFKFLASAALHSYLLTQFANFKASNSLVAAH